MAKDIPQVFELGILERVQLASILAAQTGNLMTMQVIKQFIKDVSLTEEEVVEWGVETEGTSVKWSANNTKKPFSFTPWRLSKIREVLKDLDERGGIGMHILSLFEVFGIEPANKGNVELAEEFASLAAADKATEETEEPTPAALAVVGGGHTPPEPTPLHPSPVTPVEAL